MPLTDTIVSTELMQPQRVLAEGFDPSRHPFFSVLLAAMERHGVGYRAVHSKDGLLYATEFVVDPSSARKLSAVFSDAHDLGFLAVQSAEIESGAHRIVFGRIEDAEPETFVVDIFIRDLSQHAVQPTTQRSGVSLAVRLRRQWSPGGACLVFLGPDGVGKTTLLRAVSKSLETVFPEQNIYRWRPAVFARAPRLARMPHSKPARSLWGSISYLFFTWLDFTSGYVLAIRPALSRNALVIFDRFYHDLLIDPRRYRFGGPLWMVRALGRFLPPRDLFFVALDADERTILSRKQQLPPEEIRRQRRAYSDFAANAPSAVLVSTENTVEQCRAEALESIFQYLSARLAERNPAWFGPAHIAETSGIAKSAGRAERKSPRAASAALLPADSLDCKATLNSVPPQS
jgi:thymidylate kinase